MSDYISKSATMQRFQEEIKQSRRDCIHINTIKRLFDDIDTLDEKEIIRKPFERVVERLEEKEREAVLKAPITSDIYNPQYQKWMMKSYGFKESIQVVKEEGGIE